MNKKAQGTIEYLVIMGIVVVISLVVVSVLAGMLGQTPKINDAVSKDYWLSQPVGIFDAAIDLSGDAAFVISNNSGDLIELSSIKINGVTYPLSGQVFFGSKSTVTFSGLQPCVDGQISVDAEIWYYTKNGILKSTIGKLLASCSSDIAVTSLFSLGAGIVFDSELSEGVILEEGYILEDSNLFNSFLVDSLEDGTHDGTILQSGEILLGQVS